MVMPISIEGLSRPTIAFTWEDEHVSTFGARALRLKCRCAQCQHEWTGEPLLDPATVPEDIQAVRMELVGMYGVRIEWSDGHATGIYRFDQLRTECPCTTCRP
jgi:DUF971 family protein